MSDIQWWIQLLEAIFGSTIVKWILMILAPIGVLFVFLWLIKGIIDITKNTLVPLFYDENQKRRIRRRQQFADHIESEIRRLNQREDWSDFRFAELEAEVEAEGSRRVSSILPFIKRTSKGLRREKSLSRALRQSQEKIIIVEGEPGSGKSIALRHVAYTLSQIAIKSKRVNSIIPVYVNLKELKRDGEERIDKQFIEDFVLKTLKRINDRDVTRFIDDEFRTGITNGSWFFLFDSFDEIPEILSSGDADSKIREYSDAIYDFLHGLNACRGVIASRHFKGPSQIGWSHFRVLSLTASRQQELIKRSGLKPNFEKLFLGNLEFASPEIKRLAVNPLFLGLLINYAQTNDGFPQHSDIVFDTYINHRFIQDKDRVVQRFGVSIDEIRKTAEEVAFCMSATQDLGLSPTRENIKKSFKENKLTINKNFDTYLDALEFMKLARSDSAETTGNQRIFTFSHRRFQEYFPTKLILQTGNIKISELLTNPRWRETTAVICQTQPEDVVAQIIKVAESLLLTYYEEIDSQLEILLSDDGKEIPIDFPWPPGCLHLLDLLQEGFINRIDLLPEIARKLSGAIVHFATFSGSLPHRIWALEVAGISPTSDLIEIIRPAITDGSHFLSDVAYHQVARLDKIPDDISVWIKRAILKKLLSLGIFKGNNVVFAQASRLVEARDYIAVVRGIQFGYWIDVISSIVISGILFISAIAWRGDKSYVGALILLGLLALINPVIVYSEDQMQGAQFQMYRFMFFGYVIAMLIPLILALRERSIFMIPVLYAILIMPSVVANIDGIPFEKSLMLVLFSPFFVLLKFARSFLSTVRSFKLFSFLKQWKYVLLILLAGMAGLCTLFFAPVYFWGTEKGGTVAVTIAMLFFLITAYQVISKIYSRDRKYSKVWKKWLSESHKTISVDEVIAVLPLISTWFAYKLMGKIRTEDMLQPSQENLHFIKQLVRLVENPSLDNEFSERLSVFLDDVGENRAKQMLLDELFQLIEKMKSKLR